MYVKKESALVFMEHLDRNAENATTTCLIPLSGAAHIKICGDKISHFNFSKLHPTEVPAIPKGIISVVISSVNLAHAKIF